MFENDQKIKKKYFKGPLIAIFKKFCVSLKKRFFTCRIRLAQKRFLIITFCHKIGKLKIFEVEFNQENVRFLKNGFDHRLLQC